MNDTARVWCWTCGVQRSGSQGYTHRADNPVLAHERCSVCDDVLMPRPQPSLHEKLGHLGTHLSEAYRWTRTVATEEPGSDDKIALSRIAELLEEATRVYLRRLDPDLHRRQ